MRIPQTPPNWQKYLAEFATSGQELFQILVRPDINHLIRKANDRYLHWDKLRFRPLPNDVSPKMAWVALQLSRRSQRQNLPIHTTGKGCLQYWLPPQHQEWVSIIDQQAGGFLGGKRAQNLPDDDDRYLFNSLMEEAIASSQLEGACTTREVGKELLRTGREPHDKAERMILNNYRAILDIRELKREKLTPELLYHLQKVLTEGTLDKPDAAGRFRRPDEKICVADVMTGETIYSPPPAETVEERIKEVCNFANDKSSPFIHPVVKAMALHFSIGFIHPFVDGNGRTARALFYWFMLKSGYWLFEYLPISRIIVAAPAKYARAYLYTETDESDLTYFNHYHLTVVIRAIKELHDYLARQQNELKEAEELLEDYPQLNYRQKDLIWSALKKSTAPRTVKEHQGKYRVTYNTARADLLSLEEMGFLEKTKRPGAGKEQEYIPVADLVERLKHPAMRLNSLKKAKLRTQKGIKPVAQKPKINESPRQRLLFETVLGTPAPEPENR